MPKKITKAKAKSAASKPEHHELAEKLKLSGMILATALVLIIAASAFVYIKTGANFNTAAEQIATLNSSVKQTEEKVTALETKVADLSKPAAPAPTATTALPASLGATTTVKVGDKDVVLTASTGFEIKEYLVSNKKDQIAYAEMNTAINSVNVYVKKIGGDAKSYITGNDCFVKILGWSKNDVKLITSSSCGGEPGCNYMPDKYTIIDIGTSKLEDFLKNRINPPLFYENYRKMIVLEGGTVLQGCNCSDKTALPVGNKIVLKNIETGAVLTLKDDKTKIFQLGKILSNDTGFEYKELPSWLNDKSECLSWPDSAIADFEKAPVNTYKLK